MKCVKYYLSFLQVCEEMDPCTPSGTEDDLIVPPGTNEEIQALKNKLLENARLRESGAPLTSINFETAKQYQENRPSLRFLKTHLQYVKCSSSLQWERQDPRVTKEVLHATWMFAERSQVVVIDRKLHSRSDRYRLVIPFRAFLGARFNAATETLAVHVEHIPEVQLQMMVVQDSPSTWNTQQDCSLFDPADERKILPLTLKFQPDKTNLVQIQQQFRQQAILSQAIEVGIKPDMKYDREGHKHKLEELHKVRRPIVIDPTLVRAVQLADIEVLKEARERGNDFKFVVRMYVGLEEGFNQLLRSRVHSVTSSSTE